MPSGICCLAAIAACHVPDKQPAELDADAGDAGTETGTQADAPRTTIDERPAPFSRDGEPTFQFSSSDPHTTFQCRLDGEAPQPCRSPYVRRLPDGTHHFSVRASDAAGRGDETASEWGWTIDTTAPDSQLTDVPPAEDTDVMPRFGFGSSEPDVAFDCSIDDAGYAPCTSGTAFGPLADGPHAFAVRARDRAGNLDPSPAIYAWLVDTSLPDTRILGIPKDVSASTTAVFTFFSPDAGSGSMFECALDGSEFAACTSPRVYEGLAEGPHGFAVRARDAAGNVDPSPAIRRWTVDAVRPQGRYDRAADAGSPGR